MTSARPDTWMPMYWGDYARDTGHLSATMHGAYLMLIKHYWSTGTPLADDDTQLWRIACCDSIGAWRKIRPVIGRFFDIEGGVWRQGRVDKELSRAVAITNKRSAAGRASAQQRANKDPTHVERVSPICTQQTGIPSQPQSQIETEAIASVSAGNADDLAQMVESYNKVAAELGLAAVKTLDGNRRVKARARLAAVGLAGWAGALAKLASEPCRWMRGETEKGWRADFDFLVTASKFTRLIEGGYDRASTPGRAADAASGDSWSAQLTAFKQSGVWNRDKWGPAPNEPGCKAPRVLLDKFEIAASPHTEEH